MHRRRGCGCELWAVSYEQNGHGYDCGRGDGYWLLAVGCWLNDRGYGHDRGRDHDYDDRDCGHGCMILNVDAHDRCLLTVVC